MDIFALKVSCQTGREILKETYPELTTVNVCRLHQHLPCVYSCVFPTRYDDTLRYSVHHQHNGHHPAIFFRELHSYCKSHNTAYLKLPR